MTEIERQEVIDNEHLKLMSIVHFVYSIPTLLISAYLALYSCMILFMMFVVPFSGDDSIDAEGKIFFGIFAAVMFIFTFISFLAGIGLIVSGVSIRKKIQRKLSFIITIPLLMSFPTGTLICVLSIILFNRPSIKKLYSDTHTNKKTTLREIG